MMEVNARVGAGKGELPAGGPLIKFPGINPESESGNKPPMEGGREIPSHPPIKRQAQSYTSLITEF